MPPASKVQKPPKKGSIKTIQLENFMTYGNIEFHPGPGFNVILGILHAGAKIHILKIPIFKKFTYLKYHFSQNSRF